MNRLTDEDLARIEARLKAVTETRRQFFANKNDPFSVNVRKHLQPMYEQEEAELLSLIEEVRQYREERKNLKAHR